MLRPIGLTGWLILPLLVLPATSWGNNNEDMVATILSPVTVLGTRTERPNKDLPRSVDVVDDDEIAQEQSNDLGSVVDTLPNVSLTGSPRPSGEQIQIRGLSDERVLMLIDGVRQGFSKGHLSNEFIDPDLIRQVDVERGPASVLWGSGALGGVVSVQTKDAVDLLKPGQSFGARLKGGYQSATDGWLGSATLYGTLDDRLDGLLYVGRRDNGDLKLGNGETLDHSAYREDSLLAKTTFHATESQSIGLSHRSERLDGDVPSNPASNVSDENPLLSREIALDTTQIEWRVKPGEPRALDLRTHLYHTRTKVDEFASSLDRKDHTEVNTVGLDVANTSRFGLGAVGDHALTYGIDGYRDRAEATRNGDPRPEFPDAQRRLLGAFVQDEITWGSWTVTPGIRYDRYHSESEDDVAPDQDESHVSSQLGVVWQTTDWLSLYASYAQAFRAPSLEELYATGTHFGANHFVANPNLKPEKAANKELGARAGWDSLFKTDDRLTLDVSAFRNDVKDFIDTIVTVTPLPGPPYVGGTTRSENVTDARLQGFEANARYAAGPWFVGLGYGQTRGRNETDDQPLADIAPDRWVLRIGFTELPWNGRITLRTTLAERQDHVPPGVEETAGYTVYDLLTSWFPRDDLRLDLAVGNLTDKAYRRHNAVIDEAGRNVMASLTWNF